MGQGTVTRLRRLEQIAPSYCPIAATVPMPFAGSGDCRARTAATNRAAP